jgi:hypothetical protein
VRRATSNSPSRCGVHGSRGTSTSQSTTRRHNVAVPSVRAFRMICRPMSALPPKADICSALAYVRFVPIADITHMSLSNIKTAGRRGRNCDSPIFDRWDFRRGLVTPRSETKKSHPPIREAAFASLMAPLRPVPALVDPTDASGEREASGRRRILQYDNRKTTARPARSL